MKRAVILGRTFFSNTNRMVNVVPIPALSDNYMYLLIDESTKKAAIVDPVDVKAARLNEYFEIYSVHTWTLPFPKTIQKTVELLGLHVECALVTHHHWDHAGGTQELGEKYGGKLKIYGGDDRIGGLTNKVADNDTLQVGNLKVLCMHTPCHTTGHICYYVVDQSEKKVVFTGDTLFLAGCGRFFEGTAEQMDIALNEKLAKLPSDTEVYCGHEYTVDDLKFARNVEPSNEAVQRKLEWALSQRKQNKPTVPSTIAEEKQTNPFMRVRESKELQELAKTTKPIDVMAFIRQKKNNFTG